MLETSFKFVTQPLDGWNSTILFYIIFLNNSLWGRRRKVWYQNFIWKSHELFYRFEWFWSWSEKYISFHKDNILYIMNGFKNWYCIFSSSSWLEKNLWKFSFISIWIISWNVLENPTKKFHQVRSDSWMNQKCIQLASASDSNEKAIS